MRLHARTEAVAAEYVCFDKTEETVSAVQIAMQNSIPMARIELLDGVQMDAINHYSKTNYSAKSTLFVEFHGSETGVR